MNVPYYRRRVCLPMIAWITVFSVVGCVLAADAPYPDSEVIKGLTIDWSTHQRMAQGSDNFQLTWADDDHLYGAWGDGGGFGGTNRDGRVGLGVARVEGIPPDHRGKNIWGGKSAVRKAQFDGKSWGMISVQGTLYMWVVPDVPIGKSHRNHYEYIELAKSTDHALSWTKAAWTFRQAEELTIPTFLNFGKDYAGVPRPYDEYVYAYFIRPRSTTMQQAGPSGVGLVVHAPGHIYLARVPVDAIFQEKAGYQFLQGLDTSQRPRWGSLAGKRPVFKDQNGVGWCMSVCHHPTLNRFLLCTEHGESFQSLMGIFDAPHPWGPWTTVAYYSSSQPFGRNRRGSDLPWRDNVFFAGFATKWFQGPSFTMNFTGGGQGKDNDSFNTVQGTFAVRSAN